MVNHLKRRRPGVSFVTANQYPKWEAVVEEQVPGVGAFTLSADGVLLYSGAAPLLNENGMLIYTPLPVLTEAGTLKID